MVYIRNITFLENIDILSLRGLVGLGDGGWGMGGVLRFILLLCVFLV